MASSLRKPDLLSFEGNAPENLRLFFLKFDFYVRAAYPNANEKTQIQIMLNLAGRDALERSKEFEFESAEVEAKLANWKAKFHELCQPIKNIIVLRHGFFSKHQKEGENFNSFVTSLRSKAKACEFGAMKDEMIRDRIVCGINDSKTRSLLFSEPNLTLRRAIEICELQESAENAQKELQQEAAVCVVKQKQSNKDKTRLMINTRKTVLNASSVATIIHVGSVLRMAKHVLNVEKETTLRLYASHPRIAHQA